MFTRPKPSDNEEDILKMQEEYLKEKETNKSLSPSAKVVNLRKHKSPEAAASSSTSSKQSKFVDNKENQKKCRVSFDEEFTIIDKKELEDDKVYFPVAQQSVLGDVVEKTFEPTAYQYKPTQSSNGSGFPLPLKRENLSKFAAEKKKSPPPPMPRRKDEADSNDSSGSRVSSHDDSLNMSMESADEDEDKPVVDNSERKYLKHSVILRGDSAKEIHEENMEKLNRLSPEEISKEREDIMGTVDPKILEFIQSLRISQIEPTTSFEEQSSKDRHPDQEIKLDKLIDLKHLPDSEVLLHPDLKKWLHFDIVETDKLQWMHNISNFRKKSKPGDPYEGRFDFNGYLQPYMMEITEETKTLFHHGEEPERPGYTLNELFEMCRSTVIQQRALALNTIAGILEYHSLGVYEGVIEIPITKIYFMLRYALDENAPIVLEPTLKALRNLFYNRIDEACLDFLLGTEKGLIQPRLVSTKSEKADLDIDDTELKDYHLVELDLVNGAIRTDLIPRLRYIITVIKPQFSCVEYCLQIFTRIFRDSLENSEMLFKTQGLMEFIFENYLPKQIPTTFTPKDMEKLTLILDALRMTRIAVSQSRAIAELCCSKYNIFASLLNYIGNAVVENTIILKIQTELFYLMSCFMHYGLGLDRLMEIQGLLHRFLDTHSKSTDLDVSYPILMHYHLAALLTLLTNARLAKQKYPNSLPDDYFEEFFTISLYLLQKWSNRIGNLVSYTAGHLKSVASLLTFMATMHELEFDKYEEMEEINTYLRRMFLNNGFVNLLASLQRSSNLLASMEVESYAEKINETNMPGLNASVINKSQNVLPTVTVSSPFCFMAAISKYVLITKNEGLYLDFVQQNVMVEYILAVRSALRLKLSDNWFTKIEFEFLCNLVHIIAGMEIASASVSKDVIYNFTFKLTYVFSVEFKPSLLLIMEKIIFNKKWISQYRLTRNIDKEYINTIMDHLMDVFECYKKCLNLSSAEATDSLTVSNWCQKVLPRDWIFMPILNLYAESQELEHAKLPKDLMEAKESYITEIVTCSLRWIVISESCFPEITNEISLTDRFCRLCVVFLCDNSLFLNPDIKPLLRYCMKIIFTLENSPLCHKELDFDGKIVGMNNFQDFYIQLLDQFQAVSYGDATFASCILAPLAQKHNLKWRKIVWSEYAACLRFLDCPREFLCYKIDRYLHPPECDVDLLKSYSRALNSNLLRPGTIAHKIAETHIEYAKFRQKRKAAN